MQKKVFAVEVAHKDPTIAASLKRNNGPTIKFITAYSWKQARFLINRKYSSYSAI